MTRHSSESPPEFKNSEPTRPRRHFTLDEAPDSTTPAEAPPASDPLRAQQQFDGNVSERELDEQAATGTEQALTTSLGAPRKRRWGLMLTLVGGLALGSAELVTALPASMIGGDWLALGWQLLGLGVIAVGSAALMRELWRLKRLRRHDRLREQLTHLPYAGPKQARELAQQLRRQLKLHADDPHWQAFQQACQPHHDGRDIHALLSHHLLAPRDKAAQRLVSRMSGETAVMVAISPLTLVDMALVAWRNLTMVDRICRLYGLELGYASRLRLFRNVLHNMAFAGASELVTDAGMDMLSLDLAARLSTRAGQGLGTGLLSARLGLRTQRLCRPLPFDPTERPRLGDLRRDLWQQLRRIDKSAEKTEKQEKR
ncbi:TIGR01620 family protein [Halomonas sp. Bachu 37]|uniref:YcjF family protein n=1 Tax=Halomonas kashgarensis TaxID=3084920 RepID=UPI003216C3CB